MILGVGLLLILATQPPSGIVKQLFLLLLGVAFLLQARRSWKSTGNHLVLTREGIFDAAGFELCAIDNIESVDRGLFAFKPSNGFLVRLHKPLPRSWSPGLWWRVGRRIGIGGSTPAGQGKQMSDILSVLLLREDHPN